jgi:hypothetical protein
MSRGFSKTKEAIVLSGRSARNANALSRYAALAFAPGAHSQIEQIFVTESIFFANDVGFG